MPIKCKFIQGLNIRRIFGSVDIPQFQYASNFNDDIILYVKFNFGTVEGQNHVLVKSSLADVGKYSTFSWAVAYRTLPHLLIDIPKGSFLQKNKAMSNMFKMIKAF